MRIYLWEVGEHINKYYYKFKDYMNKHMYIEYRNADKQKLALDVTWRTTQNAD